MRLRSHHQLCGNQPFPCCSAQRLLFLIIKGQKWRRVGNELGAGSAAGARLAMDAAALTAPALWLAAAAVLGAPAAQRALVGLFTTPGDVALLAELRQLLAIVMAMLLFDGLQTVLQGVVQARQNPVYPRGGPVCRTARLGAAGGSVAAAGHQP